MDDLEDRLMAVDIWMLRSFKKLDKEWAKRKKKRREDDKKREEIIYIWIDIYLYVEECNIYTSVLHTCSTSIAHPQHNTQKHTHKKKETHPLHSFSLPYPETIGRQEPRYQALQVPQ